MSENSAPSNPNSSLPQGWRWVRLGECKINPPRPRDFNRALDALTTFVPMAAVDEKTGTIARPEVVPYSKVSKGYTYFEENDVLFAKITPCMQNGKHVIARNLIDGLGFGTTEFHVIRPNSEVMPEWIHFFIRQPWFLQEAIAYFTSSVGQQRVPENFLANYPVPLPPLFEQKRIAARVQESMVEVEHAHTACEKQLGAAKALPAAYLRQVFESEEAKKWGRRRLGEVAKYINGRAFKPEEWKQIGVPIIRIQNLNDPSAIFNYYDGEVEDRYRVNNGDLLVSWSASLGVYVWEQGDALLNQHIFKVEEYSDLALRDFLYFIVNYVMEEIKRHIHGATMQHITKPEFERLYIPLPPLATQQRIASELKDKMAQAEKLKEGIEEQLEAINAVPQAILKKAFSGEM